jgi:carbon-monoxide dehydrogenase small subunit
VSSHRINLQVNGEQIAADVEARILLVHLLREDLGLTGAHVGCDTTSCGACTILLDGRPVKACTIFAVQADGHQIRTIEGITPEGITPDAVGKLHPVQEAFLAEHGLQCGFCTPGLVMTAVALLEEEPDPSRDEIAHAIAGNICRCTGYENVIRSIQAAAASLRKA